ncbi:helix-turn-helix transcriptional regulator [Neisseria leonii]|uniref:Helix-turn-helix domain-containing protein n=1 Tax=Neisseria leonii TaxID=2995413 RepID=A0A9X4ICM2_9NEIS|nr:helix-turn-helix transcriptional regulator [Neisseria sp. 51.81]MDD9326771.1 helix-turn-helix domain-containing protein [Neisseria sp. 51.81]
MNAPTDYQIIKDKNGSPAFVVLPYADFRRIMHPIDTHNGVPSEVADAALDNGWSALRAWREYLGLTQSGVAAKLGISQAAYSQHENSRTLRRSTRAKIAALGINNGQPGF